MASLSGKRVLIVEDDYLIASDLEESFRSIGAEVLGPVPTVEDAERVCAEADAAVLDINLRGSRVFPVADRLQAAAIPFVFYTAYADVEVPVRFRGIGQLRKPARPVDLVGLFRFAPPAEAGEVEDVVAILPKLRVFARLMLDDPGASDRLVEAALERALEEVDARDPHGSLDAWLVGIVDRVAREQGVRLLN